MLGCSHRILLLPLLLAVAAACDDEPRVPPPPGPGPAEADYAVRAAESLQIGAGAWVKGGAVGARDVVISGAEIRGDVYGESVRLADGALVRRAPS